MPIWKVKKNGQWVSVAGAGHGHDASAILRGIFHIDRIPTIPVTKGGTGATTAAEALQNLGAAPKNHASNTNTYGAGSGTNYGHVKLSGSYEDSQSGVDSGIAATPSAVAAAYAKAKAAEETAAGKAPAYTYGTEDLTAGESALETGKLYFVYE